MANWDRKVYVENLAKYICSYDEYMNKNRELISIDLTLNHHFGYGLIKVKKNGKT